MPITNTLQRSINYALISARGAPLTNVLNIANEPALTIGDYVRQFILGPPFAWRWNRSFTAFIAQPGVDSFSLTNWSPTANVSKYTITIDSNGFQQQVTIAGATGLVPPTWNANVNGLTVDNSVTWVNQGMPAAGITPIQPLGWLEKAVAIAADNSAYELEIALDLAREPRQNQPFKISPWLDDGNGVYTFRLMPSPEQQYTVYLTQQNAAPNFVTLGDFWDPVPDYLSYLYNQGILAKTFEYMNRDGYLAETQLFLRQVIAANSGLTDSQVNIFLSERIATARQGQSALGEAQTSRQARGAF